MGLYLNGEIVIYSLKIEMSIISSEPKVLDTPIISEPKDIQVKPASEFTDADKVEYLVSFYTSVMEDDEEGYDPYHKSWFDDEDEDDDDVEW